MMINFPPYMRNKGKEMSTVLQEMSSVRFRKPQGCPKLLLRFTSCQAYKIMLVQLPLPSLSLLRTITAGSVDAIKAAKLILDKQCISDGMDLQKSAQYHDGNLVGQDENGNFYKVIVVFMIVSLKKLVLMVLG